MHIYLKHPIHGTKVAISDLEVEYDEQNGWEQMNPDGTAVDVEAELVNSLAEPRRRGRPRKE